jgi:hypothetical protein
LDGKAFAATLDRLAHISSGGGRLMHTVHISGHAVSSSTLKRQLGWAGSGRSGLKLSASPAEYHVIQQRYGVLVTDVFDTGHIPKADRAAPALPNPGRRGHFARGLDPRTATRGMPQKISPRRAQVIPCSRLPAGGGSPTPPVSRGCSGPCSACCRANGVRPTAADLTDRGGAGGGCLVARIN